MLGNGRAYLLRCLHVVCIPYCCVTVMLLPASCCGCHIQWCESCSIAHVSLLLQQCSEMNLTWGRAFCRRSACLTGWGELALWMQSTVLETQRNSPTQHKVAMQLRLNLARGILCLVMRRNRAGFLGGHKLVVVVVGQATALGRHQNNSMTMHKRHLILRLWFMRNACGSSNSHSSSMCPQQGTSSSESAVQDP